LKGKKEVKVEGLGEGVGEGKKVPIFGKMRHIAARSVDGVLPPFKLSIKKEGPRDALDMGKKESVGITAKPLRVRVRGARFLTALAGYTLRWERCKPFYRGVRAW
jgi:hypothetical protein